MPKKPAKRNPTASKADPEKVAQQIIYEAQMEAWNAGKSYYTLPSDGPPLIIKFRNLKGQMEEVDLRGSTTWFPERTPKDWAPERNLKPKKAN